MELIGEQYTTGNVGNVMYCSLSVA